MNALTLACLLLFSGAGQTPDTKVAPQAPLTPMEAIARIGQPDVIVRLTVKHSKDRMERRGVIYLDSEEDFQDPRNLGVALAASAVQKLRSQGVTDPAKHYLGKRIEVRGCVMRFGEQAYLPVLDSAQIRILPEEE